MQNSYWSVCNLEYLKDSCNFEKYLRVNWSLIVGQSSSPNPFYVGLWKIEAFQPTHLVG